MGDCEQITLAILAGGRGSRMGKPKGLLEVRGKPILTYLLERLAWNGPKWLITAPGVENPPGAEGFDRELVDPEEGAGPLRGIATALEQLETPFVVVMTVDMPEVRADLPEELLMTLRAERFVQGAMFRRMIGAETVIEPFPLALRREAHDAILTRLQSGQRSVHRLLELTGFVSIPAGDDSSVWTNLNDPEAFNRWEEGIATDGHR